MKIWNTEFRDFLFGVRLLVALVQIFGVRLIVAPRIQGYGKNSYNHGRKDK